jgi:proteasome accessory factor B
MVEQFGRKKWRVDPAKNAPALSFTLDEAISLYVARYLLQPLAGTPFWDGAQRAFKKIRVTLGAEALKFVEKFGRVFYQTMVGTSDYSKKAEIIDQLVLGIEDRRAVFITYQSLQATEAVTYDIFPYGLVYHRGALYVVGWGRDQNEIRHWKVNRIEEAEMTQVPFQRPEDFDLQGHLAKSFGVFRGDGQGEVHVKVRFAPAAARYVSESRWHPSQKLTTQKDGSLVAEFSLGDTEEIKRWVMGFGSRAEVLEPPGLREELVAETRRMLQGYSQVKSDGSPTPRRRKHSEG